MVFIVGLMLAVIGLFFPIPGPADDPVDWIGYLLIAIRIYNGLRNG